MARVLPVSAAPVRWLMLVAVVISTLVFLFLLSSRIAFYGFGNGAANSGVVLQSRLAPSVCFGFEVYGAPGPFAGGCDE